MTFIAFAFLVHHPQKEFLLIFISTTLERQIRTGLGKNEGYTHGKKKQQTEHNPPPKLERALR